MKRLHKLLALILSLGVLATMLTPLYSVLLAQGASENYSWVLDTDGIDAGEEYLIVNDTAANSTALVRDNYNNIAAQAVVVRDGNTIEKFDGDENAAFVFSAGTTGTTATSNTVKNDDLYLHIGTGSLSYDTSSQTISVRRYTAGYYRMYASVSYLTRYVRYYNGSWSANTSNNSTSNLYLYKKVVQADPTYTVTYDGNGATSGTLPENIEGLYANDPYTVGAPTNLVKYDAANDDTYLFYCWNTAADGSGTDYIPGTQLQMGTADVVLYAKWYLEIKYTITVRCNVDNQPHDIPHNHGDDTTVYVSLDGITYLPLTKTETGVYVTTVKENGDYQVYFGHGDGTYEPAHGHRVAIYNQSGETVLQNFTVTYNKGYDGDAVGEDTADWSTIHHGHTAVYVTDTIPVRAGYHFLGWADANGDILPAGTMLSDNITAPVVLTARWEELMDVQVEITLNHNAPNGGFNNTTDKHEVQLQLMQLIDGVYRPVGEPVILNDATQYDEPNNITTYSYTFEDLPQGEYTVSPTKAAYTEQVTVDDNGVIHVVYTFAPGSFDLHFTVKTEEDVVAALRPAAVNIRVLYWGFNEQGKLGWQIITQHGDGTSPVTVTLDENGVGHGFYSVWKDWADYDHPYLYRLMVSSFVMPDGTVVSANSNDCITYTPNGSGLYTVKMEVDGGATLPDDVITAPDLDGAYFDGTAQQGTLTAILDVTPFTVVFDANEGTVNDEDVITLNNQYAYPDLDHYLPVRDGKIFDGWYLDAALTIPATNQVGRYLTADVTYYAKWRNPLEITGTVQIAGTYMQNGQPVSIHGQDRATEAMVLLLKETSGAYNVVDGQLVTFGDYGDLGSATYYFSVTDEASTYRIEVLELNYTSTYDNNGDTAFTADEYVARPVAGTAVVDVYMGFTPQTYVQTVIVDATQISQDYRPTDALVLYEYRDLGSYGDWTVISQHTQDPYGFLVHQESNGLGADGFEVWNWHTNGTLYEYQVRLSKLYGTVSGVYEQDGTAYSDSLPYTVRYDSTTWYSNALGQQSGQLTATLIPKQYEVIFNVGFESDGIVSGMEHLITAGPDGDYYAHRHTWSHADSFIAYPYRPGYIFRGWDRGEFDGVVIEDNGKITIPAGMAETVTLTATWEKIEDTAYVVRHLEKNTNKVLQGASLKYAEPGTQVVAVDEVAIIKGYVYDSASADSFIVSADNNQNVLTLYYLPDGSDGYTEQVEGNLHLDKTATLEADGTYTVWMETFTTDNPVTTLVQQNTPLDIVLVIDQSGSISQNGYLQTLRTAVENFVSMIAAHGNRYAVDHRIAIVGYAGDVDCGATSSTDLNTYPLAGGSINGGWLNTGVFDSNGDFHNYPITGFNYTAYNGAMDKNGTYYTKSGDDYLLLMYHEEFYLAMDENRAKAERLNGHQIYGYVDGAFIPLTRNSSGLWLYGDKMLYSDPDFYTFHEDVWTHRNGIGDREIHAYGTGDNYAATDGHEGVYTRTSVTTGSPELNVYKDALIPVSTNKNGAGGVNPSLEGAANRLGSNGGTYVNYGIEMANRVFAANPLGDNEEGRIRVMLTFTDGVPGEQSFDTTVANNAIKEAYTTKNTHDAFSYAVGLYTKTAISLNSNEAAFLNALSSNYPTAQAMTDVYSSPRYSTAPRNTNINNGTQYYVRTGSYNNYTYLPLQYGTYTYNGSTRTGWYYRNGDTYTLLTSTQNATTNYSGKVSNTTLYYVSSGGYKATEHSGYYATADNEEALEEYFDSLVREITSKIHVDIVLHEDTILRDIMGQGMVLTDGTVITAYRVAGNYNALTSSIDWARDANGEFVLEYVASVTMADGQTTSEEMASITQPDGTEKQVPYIQVFNYGATNPTDPVGTDYMPHTVDVTGYDFSDWYIDEEHPDGYMMVVQISRIEAMDNVQWGRSTKTNHDRSGLWLPTDEQGNRELLLAFDQPSTIFVERAYVLDYGKPFTLSGWYFDDDTENADNEATPIHIDGTLANGMNWFDIGTTVDGESLPTRYGNVTLADGQVTYTPTTMRWDGMDQFYVFGNTWRKTVLAQDANENGNLWTKVQVIPANSVYYEDSFITVEGENGLNGIDGFTFTGGWSTVFDGSEADTNGEIPEHLEQPPYGDVHGWIDAMVNEGKFSDGSAHFTKEIGAKAEFTFTGSGVDVYTRTNNNSGVVVATIYRQGSYDDEGNYIDEWVFHDGVIMDNLAISGDYYHVPTISFMGLPYGTYRVELIATAATAVNTDDQGNQIGDEPVRTEYHIDGIRVYKPLAADVENQNTIHTAYEKEVNSTFTEVRDVLIDYGDFNIDIENSTDGTMGAAFIDWIRPWQGTGDDRPGVGVPSYEIGTFEAYGPKNEVYLTSGQAVVLKVDPRNTYYVGLKSLEGTATIANVSGITTADPVAIQLNHAIDMYYQVTPVDGYIVIQNGASNDSVLSITKLRTTNQNGIVKDGGLLPVTSEEVVNVMTTFSRRLMNNTSGEMQGSLALPVDPIMESFRQFLRTLFSDVRAWMHD